MCIYRTTSGSLEYFRLVYGWYTKTQAVMPARRCDALSGIFGRRFVHALSAEITGVWQRRWNTEKFIIF